MKHIISILIIITGSFAFTQEKIVILNKETQIKMALQFLTDEEQNHAKVLGYNEKNELVVLKDSDGYLTCVADDPQKNGIEVSCYHKDLDDYMQRGRDLRSVGKNGKEIAEIRAKEVESGKLKYPKGQSILYIFNGKEDNLDKNTGILKDGKLRYVVYTPYATQETTGLPTKPTKPGMPWLMDAGTYHAHIMITPQ